MTNEITPQIEDLLDNELIEAAGYYLSEKIGVYSEEQMKERLSVICQQSDADFSDVLDVINDLSKDRESLRELLRVLLSDAAKESEEEKQNVQTALAGAGQKQDITEVMLVAGMAAVILITYQTKGKEKHKIKIELEEDSNGKCKFKLEEETVYVSIGSVLGQLLNIIKSCQRK